MLWKGAEGWFLGALKAVSRSSQSKNYWPLSAQVAIYRHALLSDLPSLNVAFPATLSSHLNSFDPCPPEFFEEGSDDGLVAGIISRLRSMILP
jgi:hypothetical protein